MGTPKPLADAAANLGAELNETAQKAADILSANQPGTTFMVIALRDIDEATAAIGTAYRNLMMSQAELALRAILRDALDNMDRKRDVIHCPGCSARYARLDAALVALEGPRKPGADQHVH